MSGFTFFVIAMLIVSVFGVIASAIIVPQGFNYTVERFGRYTRTLYPGLGIVLPFLERIGHKVNMMERFIDVPEQTVITKDNAMVSTDGIVYFQILEAARAVYEVVRLEEAITSLTMTNIRSVMGSMDMDELLSNRSEINLRLLNVVDEATQPWGVKVTRIEIRELTPPKDIVDSMAQQMKAERVKRAAVLEAEGDRQSAILRAEGQKTSQVLEAEGRREAAFRDAEARERTAEAEAKATRMVSDALGTGNVQALNYFVASNYIEALKALATADNQKVLILPTETVSLLGSLSGIAELTKDAFQDRGTMQRKPVDTPSVILASPKADNQAET